MAGSPTAPVAASTQVPTADEVTRTPPTAGTPSVPSLAARASAQRACRTAIADLRELYAKQNIRLPTSMYLDAEGSLKGVFKSPSRTAKAKASSPAGSTPAISPVSKVPSSADKSPAGTPSVTKKRPRVAKAPATTATQRSAFTGYRKVSRDIPFSRLTAEPAGATCNYAAGGFASVQEAEEHLQTFLQHENG